MDLKDLLVSKDTPPNSIIQKDVDTAKYDAISSKLCEKRYSLEMSAKDNNLEASLREENALELIRLKDSMLAFGISEINYHAFLGRKERGEEPASQLELF